MTAVLHNAFALAISRVLNALPTVDDLVRSMNRNDGLRDGSRFF